MEIWAGSPYFTKKELQCRCGCGGLPTDNFVRLMVTLRFESGFPWIIASGFRCPNYNSQVAESGLNGPHTMGLACDVRCYGQRAIIILQLALRHGVAGIGVSQKGEHGKRYLHLDCVKNDERHPRPYIWSY